MGPGLHTGLSGEAPWREEVGGEWGVGGGGWGGSVVGSDSWAGIRGTHPRPLPSQTGLSQGTWRVDQTRGLPIPVPRGGQGPTQHPLCLLPKVTGNSEE